MGVPYVAGVAGGEPRPSGVERALRLFTDVRVGEGVAALAMVANVFLILCAYYFVKSLRDGWLASSDVRGLSSMEIKAYTSFAQGLILIGVISAYGWLAARWPRRDLIVRSTLFCMSNLVLFWFLRPRLGEDPVPGTGIAFYIWVGMFGVFVVSQFWAFAADFYTQERGQRLLPLVAIGATAGAALGSFLTGAIVQWFDSGALLLLALVPLAGSIALTILAEMRGPLGQGTPAAAARPAATAVAGDRGGALGLVFRHRYLIAVAGATLISSWVATNGENVLFKVVQDTLRTQMLDSGVADQRMFLREATTTFYGNFFFWVNVCALILQALFASRLLKYGGFGLILLLLPVLSLISYSAMALAPFLLVVRLMKTAENATSYSINNTARQVLWLPTSAAMKYQAKPAIETFFVRFGDGLAAVTTMVGVRLFDLSTESFFLANVALVAVWLVVAVDVVYEYRRLAATAH